MEELLLGGEEKPDDLGHGHANLYGAVAVLEDSWSRYHHEVVCGDGHRVQGTNHAVQEDGPTL